MKESTLFTLVGLAIFAVLAVTTYNGMLEPVPGIGLMLLGTAVLQWWVAFRLHSAWSHMSPSEQAANPIINQMRWLFILGGAFFTVDILPHYLLVVMNFAASVVTIAHWSAHIILFVYLVMIARLAVSFFNPEWKNPATALVTIVGLAALLTSTMYPDHLITIPGSSYPLVSSDPVYAWINMALNLSACGLFGLYLVVMALRTSGTARTRALLFGFGMLCEPVMGYAIHFVHNMYAPHIIFAADFGWALLTGLGALYSAQFLRSSAPAERPAMNTGAAVA